MAAILQERQINIQNAIHARHVGKIAEVLVEERARSRYRLTGRTGSNKIVNFDGPDSLIGQVINVEITGFGPNSLKGVLVEADAS
jgi:tRNA-2-methylthio-N6-dimethylallyladenosine synthase